MATATKYDTIAGVNQVGYAAMRFDIAARELVEAASKFADAIETSENGLSADTAFDAAGRARMIADDVRNHDDAPEQILDAAQELVDLVYYMARRKVVA